MSMKLYAHPFSSYCQKVLIALYENDTPFEFRMLAPGDERAAAEHEALWPLKRIPVLVDDGRTVVEASIIIEHLGLHHPGPVRLIPEDPRAALDVRMMDRFFDNYVMTPMQKIVFDSIRARGAIATATASPRRGSCSTPPTAGSTTRWRGASGRRATPSASPTAPPHPRCSTPTGPTRSARHSRTSTPIGDGCSRGLPSRARWTRRGRIVRSSRSARPTATDDAARVAQWEPGFSRS